MLQALVRNLAQNLTFGLWGPKRPPGPSFFELQDEPLSDAAYASLEYPVKLAEKYGDFIYIRSADQYVVVGPEGFKHILKTNMHNYVKQNFYYNRIRFLFGHSLLTGDGEFWKQRRKIAQPAFQMGMIKHYVPNILEGAKRFIDRHRQQLQSPQPPKQSQKKSQVDQPLDVLTLMNHLTLDIALKLFTGEHLPFPTLKKLSAAIYYANYYVSHTLLISPWKPTPGSLRFYWHMKNMNDILLACIRSQRSRIHRRQTPSTSDTPDTSDSDVNLLTALIQAKDETGQRPLSDHEILDEFKTLLLTGHETTGCALTWMWYLLAENPEWRDALEQELEAVLGGRLPNLQDLSHLPILQAIFQETMRLYPPIWSFARKNMEEDSVCGYTLPKNSLIVLNLYALHRNPHYWEKPNEFNPLRFLGDNAALHTPYSFLPFSTGPRTCIASHLGTQEALLISAALAQHFRFERQDKHKTKIRLEPCISLRPRGGLWYNITAR